MAISAADLYIRIKAIDDATRTLNRIGEGVKALGEFEAFRKITEATEATVEAAAAMQSVQTRLAAITDLSSGQLKSLTEHAEKFSELNPGATAEQYLGVFQSFYQVLQDTTKAQKAADDAIRAATVTGINYSTVVDLITAAHENFGASSDQVRLLLAGTQKSFKLNVDDMSRFATMLSQLSGVSELTGSSLSDVMAVVGEAGELSHGRGMQQIAALLKELPEISRKSGIFLGGGIFNVLEQIQRRIHGLPPLVQAELLKKMGIQEGGEILPILHQLEKMRAGAENIAAFNEKAFGSEEGKILADYNSQLGRLSNAWNNLKVALGTPVLDALSGFVTWLAKGASAIGGFLTAHPALARFIVTFMGMLAVAAAAGAALAAIMTIGWPAAIAAGLAFVTSGLIIFAPKILGWLAGLAKGFYNAGAHLMKSIADGIAAAIHYPIQKVKDLAAKIRALLPFSPAKEGPLRDLNRVRLAQTLADTIRPAPVLSAMSRVAAAAAIAAPMMMATPAFAGGAGASVTVNFNVQLYGIKDTAELREALARERRELLRQVEIAMRTKSRTAYPKEGS